jgi:hypothetical protein
MREFSDVENLSSVDGGAAHDHLENPGVTGRGPHLLQSGFELLRSAMFHAGIVPPGTARRDRMPPRRTDHAVG